MHKLIIVIVLKDIMKIYNNNMHVPPAQANVLIVLLIMFVQNVLILKCQFINSAKHLLLK